MRKNISLQEIQSAFDEETISRIRAIRKARIGLIEQWLRNPSECRFGLNAKNLGFASSKDEDIRLELKKRLQTLHEYEQSEEIFVDEICEFLDLVKRKSQLEPL